MAALSRVPAGVISPVKRKAAEIVAATGSRVTHVWGYNTVPDHSNKRCVDFMVKSIADGNAVADYIIRNAQRLGVTGIIWNRRVMGFPSNGTSYRGPEGQWRPYGGPSPHTDHPHVEFDSSAYRAPDGGTAPPIGAGAAPGKTTPTDWMDDMFKNVSEFKKAVLDAVAGDRWPAPPDEKDKKNKHWTLFSYIRNTYIHARQARIDADEALKEIRELRKALGK